MPIALQIGSTKSTREKSRASRRLGSSSYYACTWDPNSAAKKTDICGYRARDKVSRRLCLGAMAGCGLHVHGEHGETGGLEG